MSRDIITIIPFFIKIVLSFFDYLNYLDTIKLYSIDVMNFKKHKKQNYFSLYYAYDVYSFHICMETNHNDFIKIIVIIPN